MNFLPPELPAKGIELHDKITGVLQRSSRPGYEWMLKTVRYRRLKRRLKRLLDGLPKPHAPVAAGTVVRIRNRSHNGLLGAVMGHGPGLRRVRVLSEGPHRGEIIELKDSEFYPQVRFVPPVIIPPDRGRKRFA